MEIKAYIFDFDYTLGDCTQGIVLSINYGLNQMGYQDADREDIRKTIGLSLEETYRVLTSDENLDKAQEFAGYFIEKADKVMVESATFLPSVLDTLTQIHNSGCRIGIVTTKFHYRVEQIFEKYNMRHLLDYVIGQEDVIEKKPNPEGLNKIINLMGLDREAVLYIGDSIVDAKTAEAAGVKFVAVTTGTTTENEFGKYPNIGIVGSLDKLLELYP
ncbi:MAG: HAD family hydrolase [Lachnospiraceae bacterium]|nr:HAD family hydrolase [Lachnospiraceae bacterium]